MSSDLNLIHLKTVDSTNNYALKLAREGAGHGTVVWADEQTMGRGRLNNKWHSEPGHDLLMSLILRPRIRAQAASGLTLKVAELVRTELLNHFSLANDEISIKPPNDLLLGGKKFCGILTESISKGDSLEFAVVGIGVNLNSDPEKVVTGSTSIKKLLTRKVDIAQVMSKLASKITKNIS